MNRNNATRFTLAGLTAAALAGGGQGSYDEVTSGISLPSLASSMAVSAPRKLVTPAIGVQGKLTFSHWHEQVSLTAPAHAVPAARVPSSFPKSS